MNLPKPRLGGPLPQRDATWFLALGAFAVTARMPFGFILMTLGPLVVIVVQGLRRGTSLRVGPLWWLVGSMLVCSLLSGMLHPSALSGAGSFTAAVAVTLVVVGTLFTGRPRRGLDRLFDGVYLGLLFHWALSMFEALSGVKMLPLLYPGANTTKTVLQHRFFVTSLFPNYNDYSVAMALLVNVLVAKMVFQTRVSPLTKVGRALVLLSAVFEVIYMGSRGCLIAILLMTGLALVVNVRFHHARAIGVRSVAFAIVVAAMGVAALAVSPWVDDNSTFQRGVIAGNILNMVADSPLAGLFGWGSLASYQAAAELAYPSRLMDPHNLLLEVVVWFGLPSLVAFLTCWWWVLRRAMLGREHGDDWRSVASTVAVVSYPVLGIVPSSTLRYYVVWLFLVVALGRLAVDRRQRIAAAPMAALETPSQRAGRPR